MTMKATFVMAVVLICAPISIHFGGPGLENLGWGLSGLDLPIIAVALATMLGINYIFGRFWPGEGSAIVGNTFLIFLFLTLAALAEELLFRGLLQNRYGIVVASLAFGLSHAKSLAYFLLSIVIGFILGGAYLLTGSFIAVFAVHLIHNLIIANAVQKPETQCLITSG